MHLLASTNLTLLHLLLFTSPFSTLFIYINPSHSSELTHHPIQSLFFLLALSVSIPRDKDADGEKKQTGFDVRVYFSSCLALPQLGRHSSDIH